MSIFTVIVLALLAFALFRLLIGTQSLTARLASAGLIVVLAWSPVTMIMHSDDTANKSLEQPVSDLLSRVKSRSANLEEVFSPDESYSMQALSFTGSYIFKRDSLYNLSFIGGSVTQNNRTVKVGSYTCVEALKGDILSLENAFTVSLEAGPSVEARCAAP